MRIPLYCFHQVFGNPNGNRVTLLSIFLIVMLSSCMESYSQSQDTLWTRTIGGTNIDVGHSVKETSDRSLITAGYTRSFGPQSGRRVWLVRTSGNGQLLWMNTFGGNNDDEGYAVVQTNDGGFAVAGYTSSFGAGGKDVYLVRTDSLGNELWTRTFGGAQDDEGYSLLQTADGGFLIAGVSSSFTSGSRDVWLVRTNASGAMLWSRNIGGFGSDGAWSVKQSSDGGYIVAGWTFSYGPGAVGNAWLVKTDSSGNLQWQKPFGGTGVDRAHDVCQTVDGGYAAAGYTSSSGSGLDDLYLIRTDSIGNELWTRTIGGSGRDYGQSIAQSTADGGFLIAGYTLSFGAGSEDAWFVKTDPNGNMLWNKTVGGSASDAAYSVQLTSDGGAVIAGYTLSYGAGVHDLRLIKFAPTGTNAGPIRTHQIGMMRDFELRQNFPNPFNPTTTITVDIQNTSEVELVIYDMPGRKVRTLYSGVMHPGRHSKVWDGLSDSKEQLPGGVYFCVLSSGTYRETIPMLMLK